jgi:hypothetical protein
MERESPGQRLVEANSTGGQGSRRAVEPGCGGGGGWIIGLIRPIHVAGKLFSVKISAVIHGFFSYILTSSSQRNVPLRNTVEPLITDTAGEFKFCPL